MSDGEFRIGEKYTVIGDIAAGEVSDVFEVVEDGTSNRFALKLLRENALEDRSIVAQFRQEAKIGQTLEHPNLVRVYDTLVKVTTLLPVKNPIAFLTMDMFRSQNIKTFLDNDQVGLQRRLQRLLEQVCEALIYLHEKGWIHRDVKPDNLLMNKAAEARLIDFSLAVRNKKRVRKIQGTRSYIAPETIKKEKAVAQTDIYSLGITVYEALTGEVPFKGSSPTDLLKQHIGTRAPAPSLLNKNVSPEMDRLVARMLAKKPADRHGSVEELLGEIRNIRIYVEDIAEVTDSEDTSDEDIKGLVKTIDSRADDVLSKRLAMDPEFAKQHQIEVEAKAEAKRQAADERASRVNLAQGSSSSDSEPVETAAPQPEPIAPAPMPTPAPGMPAPGMPAPGMPVPGMPAPGMPMPGMPVPMPGMVAPMPGVPAPMPGMPVPVPGMPAPMPGMPVPMPGMPAAPAPAAGTPAPPTAPPDPAATPAQPATPEPAPAPEPTNQPIPQLPPASSAPATQSEKDLPLMQELPDVE